MQNELETRLAQAMGLEAEGLLEQAAAAYVALIDSAPDLIAAHLRLSGVWQGLGRYRQSQSSAEGAARALARTRRWEALPFVTMRLLAFEERVAMRDLILAADWSSPAVRAQSPVLSQHLWLAGAYEQSLDFIRQVSASTQPSHLLSYSRANALRYSGRMQEATDELERCLALAPYFPFAHWTLANHSRAAQPGMRIDRVRRAMQATASDPVSQTFLSYALFKELDEAGDIEAAWGALEAGSRLKRQSLRFDASEEAAALAALRKFASSGGPVQTRDDTGGHATIFIVGMPRTGTTVLERVLSNHDQVATAGELGDFTQCLSWSLDRFASSPPRLDDAHGLDRIDFPALGARYRARTAAYAGDRAFLVDKNPVNAFNAWTIAKAMPEARILCLVRDPMDACFSNFKELFTGDAYGYSYDLGELAGHHREFSRTVECWKQLLPEQFLAVRYEELVTDPSSVVGQITRFCGLPDRSRLEDIASNTTPVLTASNAQVKEPIHSRNIGGWRRYAGHLQPLREALGEVGG